MAGEKQIPTTFAIILRAIKARLAAEVTAVSSSRIKIIGRDNPPKLLDPAMIFIRPRGGSPWREENEGGGRWCTVVRRVVDIPFYVRIDTKAADDDEERLCRASTGLYAIEESIISAMHDRGLYDGAGTQTSTNQITAEPMVLTSVPQSRGPAQASQDGWTDGVLAFEVSYQLGLSTTLM